MKNLWRNLAPFATDTSGACAVLAASHAVVIAQDSHGTVSILRRVIDIEASNAVFESVDLPEIDYTLGREEAFVERMEVLVQAEQEDRNMRHMPPVQMAAIIGAPVSALLGSDLRSRAHALEQRTGLPTLSIETCGNAYYDAGAAKAYEAIYELASKEGPREPEDGARAARGATQVSAQGVGLLGLTELDYPGRSVPTQIKRSLRARGQHIVTDWGYTDSLEQWREATNVERNLVVSAAGLPMARKMHEQLGIPFEVLHETDLLDTFAEGLHFAGTPSVLIIGEQIGACTVRRLLNMMGAGDVHVATFFMLDKQYAQESDLKLSGEAQLTALLESDEHDIVIGDASFAKFGAARFAPLMHPPAGFGDRDNTQLSYAWLERFVQFADEFVRPVRNIEVPVTQMRELAQSPAPDLDDLFSL